jgi:hypothetical protein
MIYVSDCTGGGSTALSAGAEVAALYSLFADRELCGVEYEDLSKVAD